MKIQSVFCLGGGRPFGQSLVGPWSFGWALNQWINLGMAWEQGPTSKCWTGVETAKVSCWVSGSSVSAKWRCRKAEGPESSRT